MRRLHSLMGSIRDENGWFAVAITEAVESLQEALSEKPSRPRHLRWMLARAKGNRARRKLAQFDTAVRVSGRAERNYQRRAAGVEPARPRQGKYLRARAGPRIDPA